MMASIKVYGYVTQPSMYRMNISDLEDVSLKEKLVGLWERLQTKSQEEHLTSTCAFFKSIYQSRRITHIYRKMKANKSREKEARLQREFGKAQIVLETDLQAIQAQIDMASAKAKQTTFQDKLTWWMMETAQVKWLQFNGRYAPYTCTSFKQQAIQKHISSLKDDDGVIK